MEPLIKALLTQGYAVQLVHDPTETTWEDHGFVRVKDHKGKTLAESNSYQHNPFSSTHQQRTAALMAGVPAPEAEEGKASEPAPSDSEGSTKAPSDGGA